MLKKFRIKKKYIIFFLVYLVLLTSYSKMYSSSKYTDSVTKNGTIAVAKWNISVSSSNNKLTIVSGNAAQDYTLTLTSTSEVSSTYSIKISNLPNNVQVSLDGGTFQTPVDNKIEFSDAGSIDATNTTITKEHILSFKTGIDTSDILNRELDIDVEFTQKNLEV